MSGDPDFDLKDFLPYLLNQAADETSRQFSVAYKSKYGMLRTEWRVLFHLGRYGKMAATEICDRARIHKTKVSRAVRALEVKRYLTRETLPEDRRRETLDLTSAGQRVFSDLVLEAKAYDRALLDHYSETEQTQIRLFLARVAGF